MLGRARRQRAGNISSLSTASTLLGLVHEELAPSSPARARKISRVCCGDLASDHCAERAWLVHGSGLDGGTSRLARDTTIFVSSSARPRDDGEANARMLRDSLYSVRRELHLAGALSVLIFDGLEGKPSVSRGMARRYASKIARVLHTVPDADALVAETWLHQANSLRCAMEQGSRRRTPLVFVIQDDTQMGGGAVEAHSVHRLLMHEPAVEYVRFMISKDCADSRGRVHQSYEPCTPHPTSPLLQRTHRWLDRPHFATRAHYERRLFASLPRTARVTPEQLLDQRSRLDKDWPMWLYGRRGDMARELHWPTLVDGSYYVSKEFVGELIRLGHNVSSSYAHSYLIHAYRGRTQDVGREQIGSRAFRTHNPNSFNLEDKLTKADERR